MISKYIKTEIEYVKKYYVKRPIRTSIVSRSYIQEVLNGHPGVCYEMFSLNIVVIYVIPWKVLS